MTSTTATGADYRDLDEHIPRLRADLEQQRLFRVQQLLDLAIRASRAPMAPDEQSDDVLDTMRAAARAALADIDRALRRIELGSYGRCRRCETAIPLEHLEVLPRVTICMPCQHADETGQTPT